MKADLYQTAISAEVFEPRIRVPTIIDQSYEIEVRNLGPNGGPDQRK